MLPYNLILIFACLNYVVGQIDYLNTTTTEEDAEIDAWETEIEKTITVKLKNRIEENLEQKLTDRLEKLLEELFRKKLKEVRGCCNKGRNLPYSWIKTTTRDALEFSDCSVVAGYEGHDKSPLWVIRAHHEGQLIPGKLAIKHKAAFVAADGTENAVDDIDVLCTSPEQIRWVKSHGYIPPKAIVAGHTETGTPLYIGRAKERKSLTPGKIVPEQRTLYISFAGKEVSHKVYEILCRA